MTHLWTGLSRRTASAITALILTLFMTSPASALTEATYKDQRKQFQQALKLLQQKKLTRFEKKQAALKSYPLHGYLEMAFLSKYPEKASQARINRFYKANSPSPLPARVNRRWLDYLARKNHWRSYLTAYRQHPDRAVVYQCHQKTALLKTGRRAEALKSAPSLWMVGHSQPDACDPLFKAWMAEKKPRSEQGLKRYWLAIGQNNLGLAKYLERYITKAPHKKQVTLFKKIQKAPNKILSSDPKQLSPQAHSALYSYAFKRLLRKNRQKTAETWLQYRARHSLQGKQRSVIDQLISRRLAANYDPKAEALISKIDHDYSYPDITEWRIRNALKEQDWKGVARLIGKLPEESQKKDQWVYWKGVAYSQTAKSGIKPATLFGDLTKERSFYGFLAAELSETPFQLNQAKAAGNTTSIKRLSKIAGFARAHELYRLNRKIEANREWRTVWNKLNEDDKKAAGHLALSWGWHHRAIFNVVRTRHWDDLAPRFPRAHEKLFRKHAIKNRIDRTWPLAVARQESALSPTARSHAGARGLMQLMPKTAKRTARKHKVRYRGVADLSRPEVNIALGTAYLGEMLNKFGQNRAYATAAYNAGPARVSRWLKDRGDLPLDIWIETIPFNETRRYVQNVLAFRVIYDRMAGKKGNLLTNEEVDSLVINQTQGTTLRPL